MICASRGSDMTFERSFMNWEEGVGVCCWNAPSKEKLLEMFEKTSTPYEKIVPVEEHVAESLAS